MNSSFLIPQSAGFRPRQEPGSRRSPSGENGRLRQQPGWGQLISRSDWWGITRSFRYPFFKCCWQINCVFFICGKWSLWATKHFPLICLGMNPVRAYRGTSSVASKNIVFKECSCSLFSIFILCPASSSVAGAVGMTTSGESESDDSEMGRLQGT